MERLIVDTGVLVAIGRGRKIDATLLPDDADIAIAAITASELLVGVEPADAERRPARTATVDAILAAFDASTSPATTPLCWLTHDARVACAERTTSRSRRRCARRDACWSQPTRTRSTSFLPSTIV